MARQPRRRARSENFGSGGAEAHSSTNSTETQPGVSLHLPQTGNENRADVLFGTPVLAGDAPRRLVQHSPFLRLHRVYFSAVRLFAQLLVVPFNSTSGRDPTEAKLVAVSLSFFHPCVALRRPEAATTQLLLLRRGSRVQYYGPEAGISAKSSQLIHDTVSMEHSTITITPSSNEQGSSSVTENAAGRCAAVTTPETHTMGLTSDPVFTSSLSGQQNDILTGEIIEDYAASNCPTDHNDDDDAGGC
ncbi:hypothetical protein MRX96_000199 [Rhipicephalus microplus]